MRSTEISTMDRRVALLPFYRIAAPIALMLWAACPQAQASAGKPGTGVGSGAAGFVLALAVLDGRLYAVGSFNQAGGVFPLKNVAAWDLTGLVWSDVGGGLGNTANSVAVLGGVLYVGGQFTTTGSGAPARFIASWNGVAWNTVSGGMDGEVDAMAVIGNSLYAGGGFTHANGATTLVNHIARFDGAWSSLETGSGNGMSTDSGDSVRALATIGGDL
jgi:trimeric autotransporter adhesin